MCLVLSFKNQKVFETFDEHSGNLHSSLWELIWRKCFLFFIFPQGWGHGGIGKHLVSALAEKGSTQHTHGISMKTKHSHFPWNVALPSPVQDHTSSHKTMRDAPSQCMRYIGEMEWKDWAFFKWEAAFVSIVTIKNPTKHNKPKQTNTQRPGQLL